MTVMKKALESNPLLCGSILRATRGSEANAIDLACWEIVETAKGSTIPFVILEVESRSIPAIIDFLQQLYANTPKRYRRKEDRQ